MLHKKTHCPKGHPYSGDNLSIKRSGAQNCKQCARDYAARKWREKHPVPQKHGPKKLELISARRMVWAPSHALATKNGYVAEARKVLYDKIGPGHHPCHWCNQTVIWRVSTRHVKFADALVVDHLNWDWRDSSPDNLVPSCQSCNGPRHQHHSVRDDELFIARRNGTRVRAVERHCKRCGKRFLIPPAGLNQGRGLYCSRSCNALAICDARYNHSA